jgi:hypothetical protein
MDGIEILKMVSAISNAQNVNELGLLKEQSAIVRIVERMFVRNVGVFVRNTKNIIVLVIVKFQME